jgi:hypothetical protein
MVLGRIYDPTFLWAVCRKLSQDCRSEVETMFQESWLPETSIMWLWDDPLRDFFYEARFSRLSDDGNTAYFSVGTTKLFASIVGVVPTNRTPFPWAKACLQVHQSHARQQSFFERVRVVTRIGQDVNKTIFSDLPLPQVAFHDATKEISLDWKALFDAIFNEEHLLSKFKAQNGKWTPSTPAIDLAYPIVCSLHPADMPSSHDLAERIRVREARAHYLGWYKLPSERGLHYNNCVQGALQRLIDFRDSLRMSDMFAMYNFEIGTCRGQELAVQDPAQNGWKRWSWRLGLQINWYNHAWEDPRDRGRTTWSTDPLVVEVERMARAWEKGTD